MFASIPSLGALDESLTWMGFPSVPEEAADSLREVLGAPFSQIEHYIDYVGDTGAFDTHQGVKGLDFERVLVVLDDSDARGFLFL